MTMKSVDEIVFQVEDFKFIKPIESLTAHWLNLTGIQKQGDHPLSTNEGLTFQEAGEVIAIQ